MLLASIWVIGHAIDRTCSGLPLMRRKLWPQTFGLARKLLVQRGDAPFNELLQPDIHLPSIASHAALSCVQAALKPCFVNAVVGQCCGFDERSQQVDLLLNGGRLKVLLRGTHA